MNGTALKILLVASVLLGAAYRFLGALDHERLNPLIDDSFYSLQIARNIAEGNGITYAGRPTNGFQPLLVFLAVPFYQVFVSDGSAAIHGILCLLALAGVGAGLLLYDFLRRMGRPLGAAGALIVWSLSPYFIFQGVNGLETGLAAFFFIASARQYYVRVRGQEHVRPVDAVWLGVLLGLAVLARIDLGLWAAVLAADWVLVARAGTLTRRLVRLSLCAACAAAVAAPWFLYNMFQFGSPLPTSGSGVRAISLSFGFAAFGEKGIYFPVESPPLRYHLLSLQKSVSDIVDALAVPLTVVTPPGLLLILAAALVAARRQLPAFLWRTAPLWLLVAGHVAAYSFWIYGQWFYPRYYITAVSALVLAAGMALPAGLPGKDAAADRWALSGLAALALAMGALSWNSVPQYLLRGERSDGREHQTAVSLLRGRVPAGASVGGFQSGALGYYGREWTVVNLDGVVNPEALKALREGSMSEYLRRERIDWVVDLDWIIDALLVRRSRDADPLSDWVLVKKVGALCLYRRSGSLKNDEQAGGKEEWNSAENGVDRPDNGIK